MSIQNNESETRRKRKATRRIRKLISGSDKPVAVANDSPASWFFARMIDAWNLKHGEKMQSELAPKLGVKPGHISQLKYRRLGIGNKTLPRLATSLGMTESEVLRLAESAMGKDFDFEPIFKRLAGDKKAALPYAVPEEGLTVGERAMYEEALRVLGEVRESAKMTAALRKSADDVVERAKALKSEPPPPTNPVRVPKKAK